MEAVRSVSMGDGAIRARRVEAVRSVITDDSVMDSVLRARSVEAVR